MLICLYGDGFKYVHQATQRGGGKSWCQIVCDEQDNVYIDYPITDLKKMMNHVSWYLVDNWGNVFLHLSLRKEYYKKFPYEVLDYLDSHVL